jgi:hypothetical protein
MRHLLLCFLCRESEAEPGDMCDGCRYRIDRMELEVVSELQAAAPSPMRRLVDAVLAPMFGGTV